MKLLFDENFSPKLSRLLVTAFPDGTHVRECGLLGHSDEDLWEYARENGFTSFSLWATSDRAILRLPRVGRNVTSPLP